MTPGYPVRSAAVAARMLGEEMMIMSAVDSSLYTLNDVASFIWEAADGKTSLDQIVARICDQFEVPPDVARADAEKLVTDLEAAGIMKVSAQPAGEEDAR
jgi:hypothetical protein